MGEVCPVPKKSVWKRPKDYQNTYLPLPYHKKSREYGNPRISYVQTLIKIDLLLNMPFKSNFYTKNLRSSTPQV
jgi:hypothetical protein